MSMLPVRFEYPILSFNALKVHMKIIVQGLASWIAFSVNPYNKISPRALADSINIYFNKKGNAGSGN